MRLKVEQLDKPGLFSARSADVFAVGYFDVALADLGVNHGGVDALMSEQMLNLLDRHPFVDRHGRQRAAEFVRMNFRDVQFPAELAKPDLHAADFEAIIRL